MKQNMSKTDRWVRFILAVGLLIAAWWAQSLLILGMALFVIFEVFVNWCALYQLLGINRCPIDEKK